MALINADRVRETTVVTGTGPATLLGVVSGPFRSFNDGVGDGNSCFYCISDQPAAGNDWEVGIGTYSASGNSLSRTTVLASSNSNSAVTFPAGVKDIFVTYPASKAVFKDELGKVSFNAGTTTAASINVPQGVAPTSPVTGDIWQEVNGYFSKNSSYISQLDLRGNTPGVLTAPVITVDSGGATFSATSVTALLFSQTGWAGDLKTYTIPAASGLALTDQSANYLVVSYNSGSPVYSVVTNVGLIDNSAVVGATLLWRNGSQVHYQPINWGLSTASRLNRRLVQTNRYQWASGLALGESTGNVITVGAGVVWYGVNQYTETLQTSASSNAEFWYHSSGTWTSSTVSTYNITQYDDGTNLQTLSNGRYAVNWVYRYLDGSGLPKLAYVLGTTNATQANAVSSTAPTPPPILSTMAILVGRIIVIKNGATATEIDSAFTQVFAGTTVTNHNDLNGLQGGAASEFYHLSNAQYVVATQAASATLSGYLSSTDWNTFNNKQPAGAYLTAVTADGPLSGSGTAASHLVIAQATTTTSGYLSSTDWNTFNNKQPAGSYLTAVTASSPLSGSGTSGSPLVISQATTTTNGYLSSTDWNTFNNKQPAGAYLTTVTASAPLSGSGTSGSPLVISQATTSTNGYLSSTDWNTFNNKSPAAGSTSITTVGTLTAGTWNAAVIGPTYGGTGVNNGANTLTLSGGSYTLNQSVASGASPSFVGTNFSGTAASLSIGGTAATATTANALNTGNNYQVNSLGVGTPASGTAGEIRATNNVTAYYSDDNLKTRLGKIENALDLVCSLEGFYYEANETAQALGYTVHREVGLSAQSTQKVMPEIVAPAPIDDKYLTIRYERYAPFFVEAIKELRAEVNLLKFARTGA